MSNERHRDQIGTLQVEDKEKTKPLPSKRQNGPFSSKKPLAAKIKI